MFLYVADEGVSFDSPEEKQRRERERERERGANLEQITNLSWKSVLE
jgi:hypothetical protein